MKTTVGELLELADKIENIRQDLLKMNYAICDDAADLLFEYRNIILQTKVEV